MGQGGGSRNRCCRAIWKLVWNPFLLQLVKSHSLETPALDYSAAEAGVPGTRMEITEQDVDWAVPLGPPLWKGGGGEGEAGVRSGWRRSWTRAPARRRPPLAPGGLWSWAGPSVVVGAPREPGLSFLHQSVTGYGLPWGKWRDLE